MDRKRIVAIVAVAAIVACACFLCLPKDKDRNKETLCITGEVTGISSYRNLVLSFTTDDMLEKGFCYGDHLAIEVGDYKLKDVEFVEWVDCASYFSGFVFKGDGNAEVSILFAPALSVKVGSEIKMTYDGKCKDYSYMKALSTIERDPDKYTSLEDYANFFELTGGDLAPELVYRSYSLIRDADSFSKSSCVDKYAERYGIAHMIMLPYSESDLKNAPAWFDGTYGQKLINDGCYTTLDMLPADVFSDLQKTKDAFTAIIGNDGPYLVFCESGKNCTGLMCMLIQGLCGASNDEIRSTYMKAFENLFLIEEGTECYKVVQKNTYERMAYIVAHPDMISKLDSIDWDDVDVSGIDMSSAAVSYLKGTIGLTDEQISQLREKLTTRGLAQLASASGTCAAAA